eukprot:571118-Rhodomonas_salina.1
MRERTWRARTQSACPLYVRMHRPEYMSLPHTHTHTHTHRRERAHPARILLLPHASARAARTERAERMQGP